MSKPSIFKATVLTAMSFEDMYKTWAGAAAILYINTFKLLTGNSLMSWYWGKED